MRDKHKEDWSNYWQGRSANESGDALVGVGIEDNKTLNAHWVKAFANIDSTTSVLDVACGAGSVLKHADLAGSKNLTGVDFSDSAINVLIKKFPSASGYVASVDSLPFSENAFDFVVSQFGFEYAGDQNMKMKAAQEMARVAKTNGHISLVTHLKGSVIEEGCQKSISQIDVIRKSGFLSAIRHFLDIIYTQRLEPAELEASMKNLNAKAEPIMELLRSTKNNQNLFINFVRHMMQSAHTLITNHRKYAHKDAITWLEQIQFEIETYFGRMDSMILSALNPGDVEKILYIFEETGFEIAKSEKLFFGNNRNRPAAWIISAHSS